MLEVLEPSYLMERSEKMGRCCLWKKPFVRPNVLNEDYFEKETEVNKYIGFKSTNYAVAENGVNCCIVVHKKIKEDFSFWVKTSDGTAKQGADY
jgi:hypothetical protein